ncbi:BMC domain-containing protein [Candidatus Neomarinimicrobiota bacterium]
MATESQALGMVETRGLIAAIEAADAMVKAANVRLIGSEVTKGALVTIKVTGETGAVRASVSAGERAASMVGQVVATHIIPRPHDDTVKVFIDAVESDRDIPEETTEKLDLSLADLVGMPVHQLRDLARKFPNLGIHGRDISSANKETLLAELGKIL